MPNHQSLPLDLIGKMRDDNDESNEGRQAHEQPHPPHECSRGQP